MYDADGVFDAAAQGLFQIWLNGESVLVTEVVRYPLCRVVRGFAAAGDMDELMAMQPAVEQWGREMGCARIEFCGRRGWERVFRDYRCRHVMMVKEL